MTRSFPASPSAMPARLPAAPLLPALLLSAAGAGCVHVSRSSLRLTDADAPYACRAAVPLPPASEGARMLSVRRLSGDPPDWRHLGAAPTPPAANPWGLPATGGPWGAPGSDEAAPGDPREAFAARAREVRLAIEADDAPLGSVLVGLARAARIDLGMDPDLGQPPVTLVVQDASLAEVLDLLARSHGVRARFEDGMLRVGGADAPATTLVLLPPEGVPAAELASAWCATVAGPGDGAATVGEAVVFHGGPESLEAARRLAAEVERATAGPADD